MELIDFLQQAADARFSLARRYAMYGIWYELRARPDNLEIVHLKWWPNKKHNGDKNPRLSCFRLEGIAGFGELALAAEEKIREMIATENSRFADDAAVLADAVAGRDGDLFPLPEYLIGGSF